MILDQNMVAIATHMMYDQFNFGLLRLAAVSPESTVVSISISENLEFLDSLRIDDSVKMCNQDDSSVFLIGSIIIICHNWRFSSNG
ncbi:hypothetical protein Hanom_Chr03g00218631 [Helianthus anomalus]